MKRNNQKYQPKAKALRTQAQKNNTPCWLCGKPINFQTHWKNKDSFTADHIKPLAHGGNPNGELKPAHRSCNSKRGTGPKKPITQPQTTRNW